MTPDWTAFESIAVFAAFMAILALASTIAWITEKIPEWKQDYKNWKATRNYFKRRK